MRRNAICPRCGESVAALVEVMEDVLVVNEGGRHTERRQSSMCFGCAEEYRIEDITPSAQLTTAQEVRDAIAVAEIAINDAIDTLVAQLPHGYFVQTAEIRLAADASRFGNDVWRRKAQTSITVCLGAAR